MLWLGLFVFLSLAAIWGGGYVLALFEVPVSLTLQIGLSVALVVGVIAWILFRKYRAQKRAKELEQEILKQSEMQAAMARPDRRAEILELQKRVQHGIRALQQTKVGKKHGKSALYALPWYAIIGPPGAGKTTALKHSGLVFPFEDPSGNGGVRGVGGTRNCDWWFTNDGILLDTAGRYATDDADREEWFAFLDMLRKYRPRKPINGLMVAISVADLFEATDEQVSIYATKLRARIDEIMTKLDMVLPVYVIFTKADLIGGFVEFYNDIRKSDRDQILGATLPLTPEIGEKPGEAYQAEFHKIIEVLHARALKVVGKESQAQARSKIYQFPLEFKGLADNTERFIDELFRQNSFQENPMFRGFYFTSGTQEGAPFQRIMGNMARALGIVQPPSTQPQLEPKSYFVTDVFKKVVFPDQNLAGRTAAEMRRQKIIRGALSAAAIILGSALLFPALGSMKGNRELIVASEKASEQAGMIEWANNEKTAPKVKELYPAREQLLQLAQYETEGAPVGLRWGMYTGSTLYPALLDAYGGHLERAMASPVRQKLRLDLGSVATSQSVPTSQYGRVYDRLKLYIMLASPEFLELKWASPRLTKFWGQVLRDESEETAKLMRPHSDYYLELIKKGAIPAWPRDEKLIAMVRSVLLRAPQTDRIYDLLVREVNEEVAGIRRQNIFYGSVVPFVSGRRDKRVAGAYTKEGWLKVRSLLNSEESRLMGEKWVLGEEEIIAEEDAKKQIAALRKLYFDRYQAAWHAFIRDLVVERPQESTTALEELNALSEPEWPYMRLLRILAENVRLPLEEPKDLTATLTEKAGEAIKKKVLGSKAGAEKPRLVTPVEKAFAPLTEFGVPLDAEDGSATSLAQYQGVLAKLIGILSDLRDGDTPTSTHAIEGEFQTAFRATSALLATQDGYTRPLLQPLLMRPIMGTWSGVSNDVGSAAGGLWEVSVWEGWKNQLEDKFPFKPALDDAKLDDFVGFFNPLTGSLWSFYDQNLKNSVKAVGDDYVAVRRFDSQVSYNQGFLSECLSRGRRITETFFPAGAAAPKVEFSVNLHSVSENISEVTLTIDGEAHTYQNTPEEWLKGTWPSDAGAPGAQIEIKGARGLAEGLTREGEFGLFRLIQAATELKEGRAEGNSSGVPTIVATYEFPSEDTYLELDIRTKKGLDVLMPELLLNYKVPQNHHCRGQLRLLNQDSM